MSRKFALAVVAILLLSCRIPAQVKKDDPLFLELQELDRVLFEEGFNRCDLAAVDRLIHPDLEFFHDQGGMQDKAQFLTALKENVCSNPDFKPIRKLMGGSLEVYPMYADGVLYAAIQKGKHGFHIQEPGLELYPTSVAKFTHLWLLEGEDWQLKRALSYDHQSPKVDYGPQFEADFPTPLFDKDAGIQELLLKHRIPSIGIGVIEEGALQQVRVFGQNAVGAAAGYDTIYKVASLTKPVTAILVLTLVERGEWDLDAPLGKEFVDPDLAGHPYLELLTTRHLLSHQSGFPNWRRMTDSKKLEFEFEPGTKFQYSGEGFEYLRRAVEAKLSKPFETLADELLFQPLGMHNTHFYWSDQVRLDAYAGEHDEGGGLIPLKKYHQANAAGNLLTTVADYGRFLTHVLNGAGLSQDLYQQFLTSHSTKSPGIHWGLGFQLLPDLGDAGELAVMHGGGDYGIKTVAFILPHSKRGLIVFANSENGMILWRKIFEEYMGDVGAEIVRRNLGK
jgi:CubicO group peptidase (beta-lactamase class C family)